MKKALSLIIAIVVIFSMCVSASAAETTTNWIEGAVKIKESLPHNPTMRNML